MPELPEVQTTVDGLNDETASLTITDVWTDYKSLFHAGKDNVKNPEYFPRFKRDVEGAKILGAARVGKNVLIRLSNGNTVLTHMKMTGHFLHGNYVFDAKRKRWAPKDEGGPLNDPYNRHIHLVFSLSDGTHLAFADVRKFAKIFVFRTEDERAVEDLMRLGPDPLSPAFTYEKFRERLDMRPRGRIKQVLMDQEVVAGIGNIYADEILWASGVHPLSVAEAVPPPRLRLMWKYTKALLRKGIRFGGDSDSDYRNIKGEKGTFQGKHSAYRRTGEMCRKPKCGGTIRRLVVGARSAHYCDRHQTLYR